MPIFATHIAHMPNFFRIFFVLILTVSAHGQSIKVWNDSLQHGVKLFNEDKNLESIKVLSKLRKVAHSNNWHLEEFHAINNIGNNYYAISDFEEAFNHYTDAYAIAIKHLESDSEMTVLNNIAILYSQIKKYDQAEEYFRRALNLATKNNNAAKEGLYMLNLGNLFEDTQNYASAKYYYNMAVAKFGAKSPYHFHAQIGLAKIDIVEGNYQKAIERVTSISAGNQGSKLNQLATFDVLARAYLKRNNLRQAEDYARRFLDFKLNHQEKISAFELLSEINARKKNYDLALSFKDSVVSNAIKENEVNREQNYLNNKFRFEILKYKNEIELSRIAASDYQKMLYVGLALFLATTIILWLLYKNNKMRHQRQGKIFVSTEENLIQAIGEKQAELEKLRFESEQLSAKTAELNRELEIKNRKNTAKALQQAERNALLENVISDLSNMNSVSENREISRSLKQLREHLKSDDELTNFMTHFAEINPLFLEKLQQKHPGLNSNEIRFLSYISVNLSAKEISNLLNITEDACRKRKERIIKKIGLAADVDLFQYLQNI